MVLKSAFAAAPDELVSTVLDGVARDFFRHGVQKKRSRTD